jgi:hypothetical protein
MQQSSSRLLNLIEDSHPKPHSHKQIFNLPAKLLQLSKKGKPLGNKTPATKTLSYGKTISSSFSTVMKDGKIHTSGKKIVNELDKPYLKIDELHNGKVNHFIIPKSTIPYTKKHLMSLPPLDTTSTPMTTPMAISILDKLVVPKAKKASKAVNKATKATKSKKQKSKKVNVKAKVKAKQTKKVKSKK